MPNPLSTLMSSPGGAVKPDAAPRDTHDPKGGASFQMVMDQDTDPQSGKSDSTDLVAQDLDLASELEDLTLEAVATDVADAPDGQPPVEPSPVPPRIGRDPVTEPQA